MKNTKLKSYLVDGVFIFLGTLIYAVAIDVLIIPNQLTSGGLTGIATQLGYLFHWPVGVLVLVMNVPLLVLGWVKLGGRFVVSTAVATVLSSVLIELVGLWVPVYCGDRLLVALFGGVLMGLGLSLLYLRGTSMGGSDIVTTLINRRYSFLPMGKISLAVNSVVIVSSVFVYGNIENGLCSAVGAFVSSKVVDGILLGADSGNVLYVVSDKAFEMASEIHRLVGRGATVLPATGTAAGEEKYMLMCVARRHEFAKIKRIVQMVDANAFMIVSDTREVLGNGFKALR